MYAPFGPSKENSLEHLKRIPISVVNPAFALCAKGQARWQGDHSPSRALPAVLHSMSVAAEISLTSLMTACSLYKEKCFDHSEANFADSVQGLIVLLDWAVLLSIVYDSKVIHFVAHILYIPKNGMSYHYLSILFDTLPFLENGHWDGWHKFLCDRYRVALAFFCIQHHIFHLTSIWEKGFIGKGWPATPSGTKLEDLMPPE